MACGGRPTGLVDLLQALPARGGQGGGEEGKAMLGGIAGRLVQAQQEAAQASPPSFGLLLQTFHAALPERVVILCIYEVQPLRRHEADGFLLADFVFLGREDIGVAVEHGGADAVGQHTLDDGRRARGATRMQQHARVPVGSL